MQRVSLQLVRELERKNGISIHVETINVAGKGWIGISTFFFLLKQLFTLPKRARQFNADIIVFSSMVTACMAWFLRNRVDVPMVTINHGRDVTLPNPVWQKFVPKIFASLNGVISVSRATREQCIQRGMPPEKGVALPNGFDFEKLRNFPDKQEARNFLQETFGIPLQEHKMLLTVGRKVKRKGHEWFIRNVLEKIKSKVVYVTIGDGPQTEDIQTAISEKNEQQRVFMLGRQPDDVLKKAYAAADIFVMPNIPVEGDMEGFGIVLLEANMAENPAVAADLEGIKDVITDGKNGFKIPARDADRFARTIDEMLADDLEKLSKQSRKFVEEQFSWERVAEQYISYFKKISEV